MASQTFDSLPRLAPFPEAAWREHIVPEEWEACLDAWIMLVEAHQLLPPTDFLRISAKDASVSAFLVSYMSESALSSDLTSFGSPQKWTKLRTHCYFLSVRLLRLDHPPDLLLTWEVLSDLCKVYGKTSSVKLLASIWERPQRSLEKSLAALKTNLIEELGSGIKGEPKELEKKLKRLNLLLHSSANTATYFMNGTDFLDGLVSCYKLMNPPLRKTIISTTYLSLIGLTEGANPKASLLTDQLYALKAAADAHKAGPYNINDSLVAELVTVTPILKQIQGRIGSDGTGAGRVKSIISFLEEFRKPGGGRVKRLVERKIGKGKGVASEHDDNGHGSGTETHVHQMSLITQVQDLFPDLGSGFVMKLLDEYGENAELVISHLLEGSLPTHLQNADQSETISENKTLERKIPDLAPRSTPPLLPTRRNMFDDDEFDQLRVDTSRLHLGRRNPGKTADDILRDKSKAPNKAAILSALAAFDSDDDERDDTYDIEDVGGTVDSATPGNNAEEANVDTIDVQDEVLFRAYKMAPSVFDRDAATRSGKPRMALKEETGMTDEAIEGWALMLSRDPRRMRRLEAKYSSFSGAQKELTPTAWRADAGGSGTEDSDGGARGSRGGQGGRGGRGRGGRGRGRSVAGPVGDKETEVARQRKEANKGSRANHNRREQRARKMARGGSLG